MILPSQALKIIPKQGNISQPTFGTAMIRESTEGHNKALMRQKHKLHRAYQNDPSSISKKAALTSILKTVQAKLRKMKGLWLIEKTRKIQIEADKPDSRRFFDALKALYDLLSLVITSPENRWHHSHHWEDQDPGQMDREHQ